MKTFLLGLLTAVVIAVIVGVGLQYAEMSAANAYSTENVRTLRNDGELSIVQGVKN